MHWSKPLFVLALYTGLRRYDLRLLKWQSIDLSAGVIRLAMRKTKRPVLLEPSFSCRSDRAPDRR
jgi:integrase